MRALQILLCLTAVLLVMTGQPATAVDQQSGRAVAPDSASAVYDGVTLTEDTTWRGTVLVQGFVAVAPHATLRIEPGAVIRFAGKPGQSGAARLIVQGRIQAIGTAAAPIVMTSGRPVPARGDWGGVSFASTEKRNVLEHCRIEYADTGIDARFSSIFLKTLTMAKSRVALRASDSHVQMTGGSAEESETGVEANDSELDLRDAAIVNCGRGIVSNRSSVGMSSVTIRGNAQYGLQLEECRVKISSGTISENGVGARFKGGEGHIQMTRFTGNRETALHLSGSRMKIQRSLFAGNNGDAVRLEDGRSLFTGNIFDSNRGFNIYNTGRDDVHALLNWWGSADASVITGKIRDSAADSRAGALMIFPWLTEKPQLTP